MDQVIFASLSHAHYWYEVGMLKVPAARAVCSHCVAARGCSLCGVHCVAVHYVVVTVWRSLYAITSKCRNIKYRREMFFGADVSVVWLHVGRSLLGQEAMKIMDLGDWFLKALSFEYTSLKAKIRHEASKALRR